jgi:hypothetical protein
MALRDYNEQVSYNFMAFPATVVFPLPSLASLQVNLVSFAVVFLHSFCCTDVDSVPAQSIGLHAFYIRGRC